MWLGVPFSNGATHRRSSMSSRASRHHLFWHKEHNTLISVRVDASFRIADVEGDITHLNIRKGTPLALVKSAAMRDGWKVIPNQWEGFLSVTKSDTGMYRASIEAKHSFSKEKFGVSVINPNESEAMSAVFNKWNGQVKGTGWHTHLQYQRV